MTEASDIKSRALALLSEAEGAPVTEHTKVWQDMKLDDDGLWDILYWLGEQMNREPNLDDPAIFANIPKEKERGWFGIGYIGKRKIYDITIGEVLDRAFGI